MSELYLQSFPELGGGLGAKGVDFKQEFYEIGKCEELSDAEAMKE